MASPHTLLAEYVSVGRGGCRCVTIGISSGTSPNLPSLIARYGSSNRYPQDTIIELAYTTRFTPAWRHASNTLCIPTILPCKIRFQSSSGPGVAAICTTTSIPSTARQTAS